MRQKSNSSVCMKKSQAKDIETSQDIVENKIIFLDILCDVLIKTELLDFCPI